MKIHKTLIRLTIINAIACFLFFYAMYYFSGSSRNDMSVEVMIGWIFWLGLVAYIAPQFFPDDTRAAWFSKPYLFGTLLILLGNIFLTFGCNFVAYSFIPAK